MVNFNRARGEISKEDEETPETRKERSGGPSPIALNSEEFGKSALMSMMNGVLEPKREELLKKEIPVPQFVLGKPREEWDEVDEAAFAEYQKQVKKKIRTLWKIFNNDCLIIK